VRREEGREMERSDKSVEDGWAREARSAVVRDGG